MKKIESLKQLSAGQTEGQTDCHFLSSCRSQNKIPVLGLDIVERQSGLELEKLYAHITDLIAFIAPY